MPLPANESREQEPTQCTKFGLIYSWNSDNQKCHKYWLNFVMPVLEFLKSRLLCGVPGSLGNHCWYIAIRPAQVTVGGFVHIHYPDENIIVLLSRSSAIRRVLSSEAAPMVFSY